MEYPAVILSIFSKNMPEEETSKLKEAVNFIQQKRTIIHINLGINPEAGSMAEIQDLSKTVSELILDSLKIAYNKKLKEG